MMYGVMTLYEVSLLSYQKTTNSASVINNWNDSSKCFYELVKSYIYIYIYIYIYLHDQNDSLTWVTSMI